MVAAANAFVTIIIIVERCYSMIFYSKKREADLSNISVNM